MSTAAPVITGSQIRGAIDPRGAHTWFSGALAVVATVASALTFWVPGILTGPAAMNGSARGTALVILVVAVPTLASAMVSARRGSVRALVAWLGALGYLTYNSVMFVLATPYNRLFLVYVAMLSLSLWSLVVLLGRARPSSIRTEGLPARSIAVYLWVTVALNAFLWLRTIVPSLFTDRPTEVLDGTGLATNPVFVQDLAIWLPAAAVVGVWLWLRRPWGVLLAGGFLVFWVIESVGVAVDQWFGASADPGSDVVSMSVVPVFVFFAVVGLVPLWLHLRAVRDRR